MRHGAGASSTRCSPRTLVLQRLLSSLRRTYPLHLVDLTSELIGTYTFPSSFLLSFIIIFIFRIHDPTPNTTRAFSVSYYTNSAAPPSSFEIYCSKGAAYDKGTGCNKMVRLSSLPCDLGTHTSPLVGDPIQEQISCSRNVRPCWTGLVGKKRERAIMIFDMEKRVDGTCVDATTRGK